MVAPFSGFPRGVRDPCFYVEPFDFIKVENYFPQTSKFIGINANYIYVFHMCSWTNTCDS